LVLRRQSALVLAFAALSLVPAYFAPRSAGPAAATSFGSRETFVQGALDTLLARYVRGPGVDYRAWSARPADRAALTAYVKRLAAADTTGWPREDQMTFWINAYNAITLERVLGAWPVSSITKIKPTLGVLPGDGVWKEKHRVAGHDLSLDDIEHRILRAHFKDARVHFALNCASKSCPPLAPRAWRPATLDQELTAATQQFVRFRRYNEIEPGKTWALSKIFEWYGDDFKAAAGSVPAFVVRYLPPEQAHRINLAKVRWTARDYDWSLNEP
jgi:uncharacterized protein DUF547